MAQPLRLGRPSLLPHWIPDDTYRDAVQAWLRGRDSAHAAEILNVPVATVRRLIATPEWGRMASIYRKELAETEAGVLSHLVHKALRRVSSALMDGDDHVLKDGTIIKKQVSGADAARIATLLFERRAQALRVVDGREEKTDDSLAALFDIADKLKRFNHAKEVVIDNTSDVPGSGHGSDTVIDLQPTAGPVGEAA